MKLKNLDFEPVNQAIFTNIKCKKSTAPDCTTQLIVVGRFRCRNSSSIMSARVIEHSRKGVLGSSNPK